MKNGYTYKIDTPFGELWLSFTPEEILYRCDVTPPDPPGCCIPGFAETSGTPPPQAKKIIDAIQSYAAEGVKGFSFPIALRGTPFQKKVWEKTREIPYGETVTYTQLAEMIGEPKSTRAVGRALGANSLLIVIPCHRVLPAKGGTGGYKGGRRMKKSLIEHEARLAYHTP